MANRPPEMTNKLRKTANKFTTRNKTANKVDTMTNKTKITAIIFGLRYKESHQV